MTTHTDLIARLRAYPTRDGIEAADALEALEQQVAALTEYNKTRTDELIAAGKQVAELQSQMYEDRKQALVWRDQVAALTKERDEWKKLSENMHKQYYNVDIAAAQAREAKLRDAAKAVLEVGMGSDFEALNAALAAIKQWKEQT